MLLARAMFAESAILVLDEPCAGLDLGAREHLLAAVDAAAERGGPDLVVVLATHHLEEIPSSTTHAALLSGGSLIASGPIEAALTAEHLRACFEVDVDVVRRGERWSATANVPPLRLSPSADVQGPGSETSGP